MALVSKGRRPAIPIAVLVPVAFAPDWLKVGLGYLGHENRALSHSLVSVAFGATLAALAYYGLAKSTGNARVNAAVIWCTYASHWPLDYVTGIKPTWPGGPRLGLQLYAHPLVDLVVESVVIVLCYAVYRRTLPAVSRQRAIGWLIPLGLIGMQIAFAAVQSPTFG